MSAVHLQVLLLPCSVHHMLGLLHSPKTSTFQLTFHLIYIFGEKAKSCKEPVKHSDLLQSGMLHVFNTLSCVTQLM